MFRLQRVPDKIQGVGNLFFRKVFSHFEPINPQFDRTRKFPEKLYEICCDPNLKFLVWSGNGHAILVNSIQFEKKEKSKKASLSAGILKDKSVSCKKMNYITLYVFMV